MQSTTKPTWRDFQRQVEAVLFKNQDDQAAAGQAVSTRPKPPRMPGGAMAELPEMAETAESAAGTSASVPSPRERLRP